MNINIEQAGEIFSALDETVIIFSENGDYIDFFGGGNDDGIEDFIGKNIADTLAPDTAGLFLSRIKEALDTRSMVVFEYQISDIYRVDVDANDKETNTRYFSAKIFPLKADRPCVAWIAYDISRMKTLEHSFSNCVAEDPVTGVYNRRFFFKELNNFFQRFMRGSTVYSVIMINLDNSEKLSDTYGIDVTDKMVLSFVSVIKSALRNSDLFANTGNEDFIILLPDTPSNGAANMAERVRSAIENNIFDIEGEQLKMTASFGCSEVFDEDTSYDNVVNRAEIALYQAKHNGGNIVKRLNYQNWNK